MNPSIIPGEWKRFLDTIQTVHPSAIIAGGALRDTICDNQIKDVDIFIHDDGNTIVSGPALAELLGIEFVSSEDDTSRDRIVLAHDIKKLKTSPSYIKQEGASHKTFLQSFINYIFDVFYNGVNYQLMFVECDPTTFVEKDFDIGLCKIYFDGKELTITDDFWYDYENKQLTVSGRHSIGQLTHTLFVHRPNIQKKFPNWKFVIDDLQKKELADMPPSYQKLFDEYEVDMLDEKAFASSYGAIPSRFDEKLEVAIREKQAVAKQPVEVIHVPIKSTVNLQKLYQQYLRANGGDTYWTMDDMIAEMVEEYRNNLLESVDAAYTEYL